MYDHLIVLSGGLDSATAAVLARKESPSVRAIYFDFGRLATEREMWHAKVIGIKYGIPLEIVDMRGIQRMLYGIMPPEYIETQEYDTQCPFEKSLVPTMSNLALFYSSQSLGKNFHLGITKDQMDSRPGSRKFFDLMMESNKIFDPDFHTSNLRLPFEDKTKDEIVKIGHGLGLDFKDTWSCAEGNLNHCGVCIPCKNRMDAFKKSGVHDPTVYRKY